MADLMAIEYEGLSTASGDPCTLLRQLSKGALSSPQRVLDPIIPRRTSSQPKAAQENKSKKAKESFE